MDRTTDDDHLNLGWNEKATTHTTTQRQMEEEIWRKEGKGRRLREAGRDRCKAGETSEVAGRVAVIRT